MRLFSVSAQEVEILASDALGGMTERLAGRDTPLDVSNVAPPVVDPIRRPHLAIVDPAFRAAIERDIEHCRELLDYLRDR